MNGLIWPVLALSGLAVFLRSQKRRDRIDWRSRGLLALLAIAICVLFDHWLHAWRLAAAEETASSGMPAPTGFTAWIAAHWQSILLPLYVAVLALLIDLLSRLLVRPASAGDAGTRHRVWQSLTANLLLFVATPALLYGWTATFARPGSIISDAAREVVMPVIAAYGAPAYWMIDRGSTAWRPSESPWPFSPLYREDSYVGTQTFLHDALPWVALAIVLTLVDALRRRAADPRRLIDYFATSHDASDRSLPYRMLSGPWRGRAVMLFTGAWLIAVIAWCSFTRFILSLGYWILGAAAMALIAVVYWLLSTLLRKKVGDRA